MNLSPNKLTTKFPTTNSEDLDAKKVPKELSDFLDSEFNKKWDEISFGLARSMYWQYESDVTSGLANDPFEIIFDYYEQYGADLSKNSQNDREEYSILDFAKDFSHSPHIIDLYFEALLNLQYEKRHQKIEKGKFFKTWNKYFEGLPKILFLAYYTTSFERGLGDPAEFVIDFVGSRGEYFKKAKPELIKKDSIKKLAEEFRKDPTVLGLEKEYV